MQRHVTATDARHVLLGRLIDHAPLFPPASLAMTDGLAEDRRARESQASFMLGRFVVPASALHELGGTARALSVVLDASLPADPLVESVEARRPDELESLVALAPDVYVELPLADALEDDLDALARLGLHAKVRCGGASTPTVAELARFVRGCRENAVAFKATAGLHHAVRGANEHGFLNVLAAVVYGEEEAALSEDDPRAFALDAASFRWRGHEAGPAELEQARERLHAIGSCSFPEPVAELEALGILPLDV